MNRVIISCELTKRSSDLTKGTITLIIIGHEREYIIRLLIYALFKRLDKILKCTLRITIFLKVYASYALRVFRGKRRVFMKTNNDSFMNIVNATLLSPKTRFIFIIIWSIWFVRRVREKIQNVKSVSEKYRTLNVYEIFILYIASAFDVLKTCRR